MGTPLLEKRITELEDQVDRYSLEKIERKKKMMVYTIAPVASILLLIVWKPNVIYDKVSEHKRILNKTKAFILFLVFTVFFSGIIYYLYLKRYLM